MGDEENTFEKVGDFIVEISANGCLAFVYKPNLRNFAEAKLVKTFKGETAWCESKNWAWDKSVSADLMLSAPTLRRVV